MGTVTPMPVAIMAKYDFNENEKKQLGQELAAKIARVEELEDEKKSLMSELKERLDAAEGDVRRLSNNINLGYEYRSYTCRIEKNYKLKIKEYYCVHTGKLIDTKKFEPQDFQQTFDETAKLEGPKVKALPGVSDEPKPTLGQGIDIKKAKKGKGKKV